MIDSLHVVLVVLGTPLVILGLIELGYYPLAFAAAIRRGRPTVFDAPTPLVSIIVPAYNEERVVESCIRSILADEYPRKELILVDDGSSDATLAVMRRYEHHENVTVIGQANRGKGGALNTGIAQATGEICCFVDADGVFTTATITNLLAGFDDASVGGVCGNDEPVNLDRHLTRLLALLTHGTALVRRALARLGCLTIVSGNCGAFRRRVIDEVGGFTEGSLGEDLELTWRVRAAGHRINFRPSAIVYAEVPSTLHGLWKQRIRWTRGLVETARRHRRLVGSRRHGRLGWYLAYNLLTMLVVPLAQLIVLGLVVVLLGLGHSPIPPGATSALIWIGLGVAAVHVLIAVAFDRAWRDARYLYVLPVVAVYTVFMSVVTARALWLEARGAPQRWNKLARSGVDSRSPLKQSS